jgi:glycolate oxidase iron-sulfur subunit
VSDDCPVDSTGTFALPGAELCVHCGFCLQACPTYLALEDENDSPRGRIVLMKAMADGQIPITDADAQRHLDQCLGCRGCETACPSGVPYGQLLETTREQITARRPLPCVAKVILSVFAHPALLRLAMFGARLLRGSGIARVLARLPGSPGFAMAMLASTSRSRTGREPADTQAANAHARTTVATLDGCVMTGLFADANRATERTLVANDYRLAAAYGQRCCGALHAHAGDGRTARALARANIAAFEASGADFIAVNSAGCGAMMKEYGHLLRDDPAWHDRAMAISARVRDISELLAAVGPKHGRMLAGAPIVAYDAPCHLQHGQRITSPPLAVLNAIDGLRLVTLVDSDQCCGSAGIYNLIEPDVSNRVLGPKLARIAECGASIVATGNPGCLMQIGAGLLRSGSAVRTIHPVELLDASYRGRR